MEDLGVAGQGLIKGCGKEDADEAENKSDTIGGFTKTALRHTILRNPDLVILTADDLVKAIKKGLREVLHQVRKILFYPC